MLELKNIRAGYRKKEILHGVSTSFERGKLTVIVGPNGSGKTTLLRCALGILPISQGEVTVDGLSLSELKQNEIAKRIAYLSQGKETPPMTVGQMVLHGRFAHAGYPRIYTENDRLIAHSAMERMGISELCDRELSELSGGMRQNAYVALALAQSSDYVLMDEPTSYLDIGNSLQLMRTLRELADEGKGIVAVLHDIPLAMAFADVIAVMSAGESVAQGAPKELFESGIFGEVFGVELKRSETEDGTVYHW